VHAAWTGIAISIGLVLSGCDGSPGPSAALCTTLVEVTVAVNATPRISWTPQCLVKQVVVSEAIAPSAGGPQPRWAVRSLGGGMASPVAYGQAPAGAETLLAAEALLPDHQYMVQLGMTEVVGTSSIVGEGAFTR
jgi:hypothetical protein